MGTRSTYRVIEQYTDALTEKVHKQNLVLVYLQYDGYPDGHPLNTAEWLAKGKLVNGFGMVGEDEVVFNGAGCLAAQLVERYKDGTGGTYIHPLSHRGNCGEDYTYDIIVKDRKTIEIIAYDVIWKGKQKFKKLFAGSPEEYVERYSKETA